MSSPRETAAGPAASRRRALRAATMAAATLLSGCALGPSGGRRGSDGQLYLENRTESPKRIQLSVTEGPPDGSRLVHSEYRIPAEHGLQFDAVFEPGRTYDVRAYQPGVPGRTNEHLVFDVQTCGQADPSGKVDVVVLASASGPDLLTFGCDKAYAETEYLTYVDPSEYETGTLTGPIPTPTPTPS